MGVWGRLRDALRPVTSSKDVTDAMVLRHEMYSRIYANSSAYSELLTHYVKTVKVATSRNANAVACLPVRVMRSRSSSTVLRTSVSPRYSDDVEEVTDDRHPLVRLMRSPAERVSTYDLLYHLESYQALLGNSYAAIVMRGNMPVSLIPLMAQHVSPIIGETGIEGYRHGRNPTVEAVYHRAYVLHCKRFNPSNQWLGVGDLAGCVLDAHLSEEFSQSAMDMLVSGISPGIIVNTSVTDEAKRRQFAEEMRQRHGGRSRWSSGMMLSDAYKVTQLKFDDAASSLLDKPADRADQVVASAFDVPMALIRMETSSLAEMKEAIPLWQRMAIRPRAKSIADAINHQVVPLFAAALNDPTLYVEIDDPVDEDMDRTVGQVMQMVGKVISLDEARKMLGLGPAPIEIASVESDKGDETDKDAGSSKESPRSIGQRSAVVVIPARDMPEEWAGSGVGGIDDADRKNLPRWHISRLVRMFRILAAWYDGITSVDDDIRPPERQIRDVLESAGWSAARESSRTDSLGLDLTAVPRSILEYTRHHASTMSYYLHESLRGALKETVDTSIREGLTTDEQRELFERNVGIERDRSERVARYEVADAAGHGRLEAFRMAGYTGKSWDLATDACKFCRAASERYQEPIPIDRAFYVIGESVTASDGAVMRVSWQDIQHAPLHPNCRCSVRAHK